MTSEAEIEKAIQDKGLNAPRPYDESGQPGTWHWPPRT